MLADAEYLPEKIRAILDAQEEKNQMYGAVFRGYRILQWGKKAGGYSEEDGYEVQIFPGISSVIYLAAKLGKKLGGCEDSQHAWEEVRILSKAVANHEKTFLILGKSAGKEICEKLKYYHLEQVTVSVGNHLSYPDEEIVIKKETSFRQKILVILPLF